MSLVSISTLKYGALAAFVSLALPISAYADQNLGADVVTCFRSSAQVERAQKNIKLGLDPLTDIGDAVVSVELLDLYEAKNNPFGNQLINPKNMTYRQIFEMIENKIKAKSGVYYTFKGLYEGLMTHAISSPGGVKNVDDSDETIVVPGNCTLMQLAVQERESYSKLLESFTVNTRLFDALSERDKAAFLIHEVIYAIELHVYKYTSDSFQTRKRVRALFTEGDWTAKALSGIEVMIKANREVEEVGPTTSLNLFGNSLMGTFVLNYKVENDEDARLFLSYYPAKLLIRGKEMSVDEGPIVVSSLDKATQLSATTDFELDGYKIKAGPVLFYDNENLKGFVSAADQVIQGIPVKKDSAVNFDQAGKLKEWVMLGENFEKGGLALKRGTQVYLENGEITTVYSQEVVRYKGLEFSGLRILALAKNGAILEGTLAKASDIQGFKCSERVKFYASGRLHQCTAVNSTWKGIVLNGPLTLFENGSVEQARLANTGKHFVQTEGSAIYYQNYQGYRLALFPENRVSEYSSANMVGFHPSGAIKYAVFLNAQKFGKTECEGLVQSYDRKGLGKVSDWAHASDAHERYLTTLTAAGAVVKCSRK